MRARACRRACGQVCSPSLGPDALVDGHGFAAVVLPIESGQALLQREGHILYRRDNDATRFNNDAHALVRAQMRCGARSPPAIAHPDCGPTD